MPIFGSRDAFGRSRFGQANYGELVLYNLLPRIHRALDEDRGFPVKRLFRSFQEEMEELRREIDLLPFQRDPYLANGLDYPSILIITNAVDDNGNVQIRFDVEHRIVSVDQIDILGTQANVMDGRFEIEAVIDDFTLTLKRESNFNLADVLTAKAVRVTSNCCLVEILDVTPYTEPWGDLKRPLVKLTLSNPSNVELGLGFTAVIEADEPVPPPENAFLEPDRAIYKVVYVRKREKALGYDIEVICDGGVRLEDLTGDLPDRIITLFKRPSSLALLANDYGLVSDDNLPDIFQRTEIANVFQFLKLKSSKKAYEARSAGGGFNVTVTQLYRVCDERIDDIPDHNLFIGTTGAGNTAYYTDITIVRPRYDELSADVVLPSGRAITDIVLFSVPETTALSQEVSDFFDCLFNVLIKSITLLDDPAEFEPLGYTTPVYEVGVNVNDWPNEGWQIADLSGGAFSLKDGDEEYVIDGSDADDRMNQPQVLLHIQVENINFEVGDTLCVAYRPTAEDFGCCPCPSAEIMITIEALPAFINRSGYSGIALSDAVKRILTRLKREQVPIHVHTAIERLVINIDVEVPRFDVEDMVVGVEIEPIVIDFEPENNRLFDCRYDDIPADEIILDECAYVLSYPGVEVDILEGAPPQSGEVIDIVLPPLDAPTITVQVLEFVQRDIVVDGSSYYDDIPADDEIVDNRRSTMIPEVSVEVTTTLVSGGQIP